MSVIKRLGPVLLLALMMVLVPAMGAPNEELLQDTLKSILVSFFALGVSFTFLWRQGQRAKPVLLHRLLFLPMGLMAYALGSMVWSHAYLGGVEAIRWFVWGLILLVGMNTLTLGRTTCLAWGIHLGAVTASLWTALQFWVDFRYFAQGPNPASTFVNRNFFAEYLVCTLPFSAFLLTRVRDKATVLLLAFSLAFNVVALMMTGTRSALLGLLILLVLLPCIAWLHRRQSASDGWRLQHGIGLVAVLVGTVVMIGSINTLNPKVVAETGRGDAIDRAFTRTLSIGKAKEYSQGSFSTRTEMWMATCRMILAHPIVGVGAGAWEVQSPRYQTQGSQIETDYYAHNEILQLLAEYGLVGWLFLTGLLAYLLKAAYGTWRDRSEKGQREAPLRAFTLASLLVLLLVSNAGFPWHLATTGALFALSLAILAASDARLNDESHGLWCFIQWRPNYTRWGLAIVVACTAIAGYITVQAVECESKLVRAVRIALTISESGIANDPRWEKEKSKMLDLLREGIAINPHYRKLTPIAADAMAGWGDWRNATWVWETVLGSRPFVVVMLANVARAQLQLGDVGKAQDYLDRARRIQPSAPALATLEVVFLSRVGKEDQAMQRAQKLIEAGIIDRDLMKAAYVMGLRHDNPTLAIQALELGIKTWPNRAVDGWLKLGDIYDSPSTRDEGKALQAYRTALQAAPTNFKNAILAKIPPAYRARSQ